MISVKNYTMEYVPGKGIYDVEFTVPKGTVVGFLGPNGSGKTTTIRSILGFMRGQKGECTIDDKECFTHSPELLKKIGYIPGEPAFPDGMTGIGYLNYVASIRKCGREKMNELIKYFDFDPKGSIKRMSKGMKQKTAIVSAFMHDPDIYILDEPTSGLDPIMQSKFIDLVMAEKQKGKTILMSSHIFAEVERASDTVVIIKQGRIVAKEAINTLKKAQKRVYVIESKDIKKIKGYDMREIENGVGEFTVSADAVDKFIKEIAKYKVDEITSKEVSLETIFLDYYKDSTAEQITVAEVENTKGGKK